MAPAAAAATAAVPVALANTMTRSAGTPGAGNSMAGTGTTLVPDSSVTRSPPSLIAATCAAHPSSSVTSWPDSKSAAPYRQPIAPDPAMTIFMTLVRPARTARRNWGQPQTTRQAAGHRNSETGAQPRDLPTPMPNSRCTRAQNASRSHSRASWYGRSD